jgi:hypothetical protein
MNYKIYARNWGRSAGLMIVYTPVYVNPLRENWEGPNPCQFCSNILYETSTYFHEATKMDEGLRELGQKRTDHLTVSKPNLS